MKSSYGNIEMNVVRINLTIFIAACLLFVSGVLGVTGFGWLVVAVAAASIPIAYWRWIYAISENKYAEPAPQVDEVVELPWKDGTAASRCYDRLRNCSDHELRLGLTHIFVDLFCDEAGNFDGEASVSGADFVEATSNRIYEMVRSLNVFRSGGADE